VSALSSLEEGFEETLTLHRLGLFPELRVSFKATNCVESLMALHSRYTNKVDHWRNSSQKHRWVATALMEIEPGLRKVKSYKKLWKLREALRGNAKLLREAA
jgi:putative transposase